jgi:hypothetical protein
VASNPAFRRHRVRRELDHPHGLALAQEGLSQAAERGPTENGAGSPYLAVFRFVGVTAFIGYSVALWQMSIWYHRSWSTTAKATVDGLIYALLTAGTFGWLWPR